MVKLFRFSAILTLIYKSSLVLNQGILEVYNQKSTCFSKQFQFRTFLVAAHIEIFRSTCKSLKLNVSTNSIERSNHVITTLPKILIKLKHLQFDFGLGLRFCGCPPRKVIPNLRRVRINNKTIAFRNSLK